MVRCFAAPVPIIKPENECETAPETEVEISGAGVIGRFCAGSGVGCLLAL